MESAIASHEPGPGDAPTNPCHPGGGGSPGPPLRRPRHSGRRTGGGTPQCQAPVTITVTVTTVLFRHRRWSRTGVVFRYLLGERGVPREFLREAVACFSDAQMAGFAVARRALHGLRAQRVRAEPVPRVRCSLCHASACVLYSVCCALYSPRLCAT